MSASAIAAVRIGGRFVRVRVAPNESMERAMSRAWWIANNAVDKPELERECLSMIWANESYNGMTY